MKQKKKKIAISVTNDLSTDQRIHKIAKTLNSNNFDVLLIGRKLKTSTEISSKFFKIKRFRLFFNKGAFFYSEYNFRLFFYLLFHRFDILLSNDLDTLLSNFIISKIKNKILVYDSHEYFTEVPELVSRPKVKKIWTFIEEKTLPKVKHSYTVCCSIAEIYSKKYDIKMSVVRNVPFFQETNFTKKTSEMKIIIYQGAINLGRGIDLMIESMKYIENAVFWIVGAGDVLEKMLELTKKQNLEEKVKFWGKIKFEDLKNITIQADLGISFEENLGLNYYYALPNKIFDYIHASIPVLVSPFPEMKQIVEEYDVGTFIETREPQLIGEQINNIFKDENTMEKWRNNTIKAQKELCWQNEEKIIEKIFNNL